MAKFDKTVIENWRKLANDWLVTNTPFNLEDVKTGIDAWTVAHRSGITSEAYADRSVVDAHIQTALEAIFPNAVFKDKKLY